MTKTVYVTVDTEIWSQRKSFEQDIEKPLVLLSKLSRTYNFPVNIFLSISPKFGMTFEEYYSRLEKLFRNLDTENLYVSPHMHVKGLFGIEHDEFGKLSPSLKVKVLKFGRKIVKELSGQKSVSFRAGGFNMGPFEEYYLSLSRAGFVISSNFFSSPRLEINAKNIARRYGVSEVSVTRVRSFLTRTFHQTGEFYPKWKLNRVILGLELQQDVVVLLYHSFNMRFHHMIKFLNTLFDMGYIAKRLGV